MLFTPFSPRASMVPTIFFPNIIDAALEANLPVNVYSNPLSLTEWSGLDTQQKTLLLQYYTFLRNSYFTTPNNPSQEQGTVGAGIKNLIFGETQWNAMVEALNRIQKLILDTTSFTSSGQPIPNTKTNLVMMLNAYTNNYNNVVGDLTIDHNNKMSSMHNVFVNNKTESGEMAIQPITLDGLSPEIRAAITSRDGDKSLGGSFIKIVNSVNDRPANKEHMIVLK